MVGGQWAVRMIDGLDADGLDADNDGNGEQAGIILRRPFRDRFQGAALSVR